LAEILPRSQGDRYFQVEGSTDRQIRKIPRRRKLKTTKSSLAASNKSQPTAQAKPQNFKALSLIAGLVLALLPVTASAQISFGDAIELKGTGYAARIAVDGDNAVEVFQSESGVGALEYRTGKVGITGGVIAWKAAKKYETGIAPSVAISGSYVIEVHEDGSGGLWYLTGKVASTGTITWATDAIEYTKGYAPSVAASGTQILEVHQASQSNPSELWYEAGQFNTAGTVAFQGGANFTLGFAPSVALAGATFVEVHQGTSPALWYVLGTIQAGNSVKFGSGFNFDQGYAPTVAIAGPTIVEAHEDGGGEEWYSTGLLQSNGTVAWGTSSEYQAGSLPSIAIAGPDVSELHEGSGTIWSLPGQF
jgi:hypothetical protein